VFGESKKFLGEKFIVILDSHSDSEQEHPLHFKGIVTSINSVKGFYYGDGDLIEIMGKSTSVIADDGPHFASYLDYDLAEILQRSFKDYNKSLLELNIAPENNSNIHYSVQQNESAFKYASRLASQYGEWFYYDGTQLVFGQPPKGDSIKLNYGADLMELSINMAPTPNKFKYITNDYFTDTFHETKTEEIRSNANGQSGYANSKSDSIYPNETQVYINAYDDPMMKHRMDEQIKKQKMAQEASQVKVIGKSYNTGVQIGAFIEIEGEESYYGNYRVIKVTHDVNLNGHYENSFEAIPESVSVYPKASLKAFPKSKSQTAVVVNNNDPEGLGRVQVQYPWQKPLGETTPFVRLSSTSAGAGQGFFMVPEIGDEVVVGYEGGNAESPIIQGSLYNASSVPESFKSGNNHLKAIKTRSGNQVTLNDADGSVTIADPSGNTIIMGGNGEITINAPNKIT
ncbi:phage baseplate assembly protein V, partial [uncultured Algibacter sp.]|uniref:type VI secretion system Vgr family protein n=1 Tax=uncultured Algibacter sp. TaxID=298659 RepID=UPI003217E487